VFPIGSLEESAREESNGHVTDGDTRVRFGGSVADIVRFTNVLTFLRHSGDKMKPAWAYYLLASGLSFKTAS